MIHRITLENFFSFKDPVTIELSDINILLGINGSGKSNLLKAIQLLHEAVFGKDFESIFQREWGGFNQVANSNGGHAAYIRLKFELDARVIYNGAPAAILHEEIIADCVDRVINNGAPAAGLSVANPIYEINIYPEGATFYYLTERIYIPNANFTYIDSTKIGQILIFEGNSVSEEPRRFNSHLFSNKELLLGQVTNSHVHQIKECIAQIATYSSFDTSFQSPIRRPAEYSTEQVLMSDGSNLAQVLNKIKINNTIAYDKIEKLLTKVNPNFKSIEFEPFLTQLYLSLKEHNLNRTVGAMHISDGTLRFLLYITMLYNPNRGKLICIDEPENGLHPDMIDTIADAMKEAAKTSQLLIATHSPLLLNRFELDNIIVFEKNENNETTMERKSEEQFEDWEGEFLPGQMWLRGQLGGKRW